MIHKRSAFSDQRSVRQPLAASRGRGFSLIEVLLAIFILGIGVISITALFPAGIAQQRLSVDDMNGPIVASNAIEIIRGKVRQVDFGTIEEFDPDPSAPPAVRSPRPTVPGDWTWLRPAFLFANDTTWPPAPSPPLDETGAIDIFSWYAFNNSSDIPGGSRATEFPAEYVPGSGLYGVPFNTSLYPTGPPRILITREERYYPMTPRMFSSVNDVVRPQYVWDCAFRRFQGKILVAIFVYRVTVPGGGAAPNYTVAQNPSNNIPPLPIWLNLVFDPVTSANPPTYCAAGAWDAFSQVGVTPPNAAVVLGVASGTTFNPDEVSHAWQQPRQWIVDQNNGVHRVLGQSREDYDAASGDVKVELVRPIAPVMGRRELAAPYRTLPMGTAFYYLPQTTLDPAWQYGWVDTDLVTDIWYVPLVDSNGMTLTPVYATVKEL